MKAPVFTPAVAALTLATVLFSSGTTYSNTRSYPVTGAKTEISPVTGGQGAGLDLAYGQPGYRRVSSHYCKNTRHQHFHWR